ncbi:MAG TPA: gamma-glutamyl-gamma-aminobutyrate hydrolase family protein [Vicinamibacterales bacterium]|jgi:putative glutamine amidotransferase
MPPVIGVAACSALPDYLESIRRSGGEPLVLTPGATAPDAALATVRGLLLTGGGDVDPQRYGQTPHASVVRAKPERDTFEIALVQQALATDLPILAVCRGAQVLNVACGGTLVQDIPSAVERALNHQVSTPAYAIAHDVWLTGESLLWKLMSETLDESDTCAVNSRHHQAILDLAAGLQVCATAPDGVIEGVEMPSKHFCLAVQWHPENFWRTGEFRALFEGFIEACR